MASPFLGISWVNNGVNLGQLLPVQFANVPTLTSLTYRAASLKGIFLEECNSLLTVSCPNLTSLDGFGNTDFYSEECVQIANCTALTSVSMPALTSLTGGMWIDGCTALTSVDFTSLATMDFDTDSSNFWIEGCTSLTSASFPALTTIVTGAFVLGGWFSFFNCTSLNSFSFPNLTVPNKLRITFQNCALDQTSVDHILARCVANAGYVSGIVRLNGGTNSTPSASGLADAATLTGRGVTVTTN